MKNRILAPFATFAAAVTAVLLAAVPQSADAFCGTYVSGGGADLFNDATQVVMMRDGNRTVMSMQNTYEGPPDDFAMIVPVPMVLQKSNVKTLKESLFDKADTMTAPRLVEYYEMDPCEAGWQYDTAAGSGGNRNESTNQPPSDDVTVEEKFKVGEYDVVILSSTKSSSLESWLTGNGYNIPSGAAPYLEPYIQSGSKFFVAKVDTSKVTFKDGSAVLSPLRFHYDSPEFKLPVRLGMINSKGKQDLIVNILARGQRYKAANYPNVTIPTNIEVVEQVKDNFGAFYRALFKETMRQNPGAMVTEYSWNAATCDPCPGAQLTRTDIEALGAEVIDGGSTGGRGYQGGWVITRLHTRYSKGEIGKDIVFEKAEPIVGGREMHDENGNLIQGAQPANYNNFQGRYIIRHYWDKPVTCANPQYGRWTGSPNGVPGMSPRTSSAKGPTNGGTTLASGGSGEEPEVSRNVRDDIPELGIQADPKDEPGSGRACSAVMTDEPYVPAALLALFVAGLFGYRLRRR